MFPLKSVLLCISIFASASCASAQADTLSAARDTSQFKTDFRKKFSTRWNMQPHSPMKATIYAAVLPSAGQIYNKKYWKAPIVYACMGACVGFIIYNTHEYKFYKKEYIAAVDNDASTQPTINASSTWLNQTQDQYHRWMDVSYMALAGFYMLQIIDANVDGHLFYFDVGNKLSMRVHPSFVNTGQVRPALGFTLGF